MCLFIFTKDFLLAGIMAGLAVGCMWYNRKNLKWVEPDSKDNEILTKLAWLFVQADAIPEASLKKEVKKVISELVYSSCKGVNLLDRWYDILSKMGGKEE